MCTKVGVGVRECEWDDYFICKQNVQVKLPVKYCTQFRNVADIIIYECVIQEFVHGV